jgi:small ligand-binding sensory domain FIST
MRQAAPVADRTAGTLTGDGLVRGPDVLARVPDAVAAALAPLGGQAPDLVAVFTSGSEPAVAEAVGRRRDDDRAVLLLADPYSFPAEGFVEQANTALGGLPFVGGLASGVAGPGSVRLLLDGRAVDRGAVGVLLGGDVEVAPLVSQGCRPVGLPMTVTRSAGNVLLELAGTPALAKLREVLGALGPEDRAAAAGGISLGVAIDEYADAHDHGDFLVRAVLGADADRDGLVVGELVEVGRTVQFLVRDADAADAELRLLLARLRRDRAPSGALLVSCNGRGAAMFDPAQHGGADHDVRTVRDGLGLRSGVGGFFAAGEIGPVAGRNHLHGFTACVLAFGGRT